MEVCLCNTLFLSSWQWRGWTILWEFMATFPCLRKLYLVVYNIQNTAKVWNREKLYLFARKAFIICCQQNDLLFGKECRTHVSMACRVNRQWALNVGITAGWGRCCLRNDPRCEVAFLVRFVWFLVTFVQKICWLHGLRKPTFYFPFLMFIMQDNFM